MFQVDLELHEEFCMATQKDSQVPPSPKVDRLMEIIIMILKRGAVSKK